MELFHHKINPAYFSRFEPEAILRILAQLDFSQSVYCPKDFQDGINFRNRKQS